MLEKKKAKHERFKLLVTTLRARSLEPKITIEGVQILQ